jgi:hypothetical protein
MDVQMTLHTGYWSIDGESDNKILINESAMTYSTSLGTFNTGRLIVLSNTLQLKGIRRCALDGFNSEEGALHIARREKA